MNITKKHFIRCDEVFELTEELIKSPVTHLSKRFKHRFDLMAFLRDVMKFSEPNDLPEFWAWLDSSAKTWDVKVLESFSDAISQNFEEEHVFELRLSKEARESFPFDRVLSVLSHIEDATWNRAKKTRSTSVANVLTTLLAIKEDRLSLLLIDKFGESPSYEIYDIYSVSLDMDHGTESKSLLPFCKTVATVNKCLEMGATFWDDGNKVGANSLVLWLAQKPMNDWGIKDRELLMNTFKDKIWEGVDWSCLGKRKEKTLKRLLLTSRTKKDLKRLYRPQFKEWVLKNPEVVVEFAYLNPLRFYAFLTTWLTKEEKEKVLSARYKIGPRHNVGLKDIVLAGGGGAIAPGENNEEWAALIKEVGAPVKLWDRQVLADLVKVCVALSGKYVKYRRTFDHGHFTHPFTLWMKRIGRKVKGLGYLEAVLGEVPGRETSKERMCLMRNTLRKVIANMSMDEFKVVALLSEEYIRMGGDLFDESCFISANAGGIKKHGAIRPESDSLMRFKHLHRAAVAGLRLFNIERAAKAKNNNPNGLFVLTTIFDLMGEKPNGDLEKKILHHVFSKTDVTGQDVFEFISSTAGIEIVANVLPMTSTLNYAKRNNIPLRDILIEMFKIEEFEILKKGYLPSNATPIKKKSRAL